MTSNMPSTRPRPTTPLIKLPRLRQLLPQLEHHQVPATSQVTRRLRQAQVVLLLQATSSRRLHHHLHQPIRPSRQVPSIEYGYRVPFGGIHVFIGKIGEPGPELDTCTDLIETAQRARPARVKPAVKRAFVGVIHRGNYDDGSASGGETVVYSGDESSTRETESLYQVQDGRIGGSSDGDSIPDPSDLPSRVGIFMAGTQ